MAKEFFKVSSGLKTLIGSELITDKFVAVFELVKNSYDAKATTVTISFTGLRTTSPSIVIKDNGKGMSYDDLINKWLFVAYSAKRDGSEDRKSPSAKRMYAGAKGIGRFSCDRLGRYLNLTTIEEAPNPSVENLSVDWSTFELDQNKEFTKIPVVHDVLESKPPGIRHGTILEITGFDSSEWTRNDLIRLKDRLSKLIRPEFAGSTQRSRFQIVIEAPDETPGDVLAQIEAKKKPEDERDGFIYQNVVNGTVQNRVFDELDLRTTRIEARAVGDVLTTTLSDRNDFVYEITEKNDYPLLQNVSIVLYFLNRSSKVIFTRKMGIEPVNYGNIFVYKNGFRINPYGDRGDDSFGLDTRAGQGYARYLAPRNLIGQVDIRGDSNDLRETTSRAGGLVRTLAYFQLANLRDGLLVRTLKRLEKFVVEVIDWGIADQSLLDSADTKTQEKLVRHISNVVDDSNLLGINFNRDLVNLVAEKEVKSARRLVRNFRRLAAETKDPLLENDAKRVEKVLESALKRAAAAEAEAEKERKAADKAKQSLEAQVGETNFVRAVVGTDTKELISIQHHIHRHSANHIAALLDRLIDAINKDSPKQRLLDLVNQAILSNKKVITLSRFVTKATFDTMTDQIQADLVTFINEYAVNVYLQYKITVSGGSKATVKVINPDQVSFKLKFQPIEIIIILDNLLNNSFKAKATEITLSWEQISSQETRLHVVDNGSSKIPDSNLEKIFEFRFSTTKGSGLGLYHAKQVIEGMGGSISVNNKLKKGTEFTLIFRK